MTVTGTPARGAVDAARHREVLRLRRAGELGPPPALPDLEGRYNARYAIALARRLSPREIATLAGATALREEGLRLVRSGADVDGAALVAQARWTAEEGALGTEAALSAESFQRAAEALVAHVRADQQEAERLLLGAMDACARLGDEYGYRVSMRRVHLGRNVVRVVGVDGRPVEALELAHHLIALAEGASRTWPWPELAMARPDRLTDDVRHFLLDQLLAEVARLTAATHPARAEVLAAGDRIGLHDPARGSPGFGRPHAWLAARRCAAAGRWTGFLDGAAAFFAEPPGRYGAAWRALAADLDRLGEPAP